MRFLLVAAPLLVSATAFAQAPGETDPSEDSQPTYSQPPSYTPAVTPVVVADPCNCGVNPMAHRFAVGVNFGGLAVKDKNADNTIDPTNFHTAELSLRYRFTPHFELELLLSGGREVLPDNTDGDLAMGGGTLNARYRFRPDRKWNWWLSGGLGATVIERHDSTQNERDNAQRGHVAFGIGLERRFSWLALHAEMRGIAMGQRADASGDMATSGGGDTRPPAPDGGRPPIDPPVSQDVRHASELSGGQFTLGASIYF